MRKIFFSFLSVCWLHWLQLDACQHPNFCLYLHNFPLLYVSYSSIPLCTMNSLFFCSSLVFFYMHSFIIPSLPTILFTPSHCTYLFWPSLTFSFSNSFLTYLLFCLSSTSVLPLSHLHIQLLPPLSRLLIPALYLPCSFLLVSFPISFLLFLVYYSPTAVLLFSVLLLSFQLVRRTPSSYSSLINITSLFFYYPSPSARFNSSLLYSFTNSIPSSVPIYFSFLQLLFSPKLLFPDFFSIIFQNFN